MNKRERLAIHAAGRAVIKIADGGKADHLTIVPYDPDAQSRIDLAMELWFAYRSEK
jgi:hypothetical protein